MSVIVNFDDRDSNVVYSAGWNLGTDPGDFKSTATFTTTDGSKATFTFRGTGVTVFGGIPGKALVSVPPLSSYSVDGDSPTLFRPHLGEDPQVQQAFYKSPDLFTGLHTLVITAIDVSDVALNLDFFAVEQTPADVNATTPIPSPATSASSSSPSSVSSTATSSSISASSSSITTSTSSSITTTPLLSNTVSFQDVTVTITASSSTSLLPRPTLAAASNASSSSRNAGSIAGGVVGTIALLFLLGFAFTWWRKRQQNREADMLFNSNPADPWRPPDSKGYIDPYPITSQSPPPRNLSPPTSDSTQFPGGYLPYGASSTTTNANNNEYNYGAVGAQPIYHPQQQQQQGDNRNIPYDPRVQAPQFPVPANNYGAVEAQPVYPADDSAYGGLATSRRVSYLLPSQIMNQSSDYGRGMPVPPSQYNANGSGTRTRINLD